MGKDRRCGGRANLCWQRQRRGKKAYVIDWLRSHGITVDEEKLDALIEAAVYELNQGVIPIEGIAVKEGADNEQ